MLRVPHVPQTNPQGRNSCLPACVSMVLAQHGLAIGEAELCDLLGTERAGTEVWNVLLLEQHIAGCQVRVESGSFAELQSALDVEAPVIALVATRHLHYWGRETIHAVVVVGLADDAVHVHDPAFPDTPRAVPHVEFRAAWSELDFLTVQIEMPGDTAT